MSQAQRIAEAIWPEDAASREKGETVALFRGGSATVKGAWIK